MSICLNSFLHLKSYLINMEAKRYWIVFWVMIFLSVAGELLLLFAAAYIAVAIYTKSTFSISFFIALLAVSGVIFRLSAEIIKKKGLNL